MEQTINKPSKPSRLVNIRKNNKLKHEAASDLGKGVAKPLRKDRVFKSASRDQSQVRTVRLDAKTTVLLYPNDARYNIPTSLLQEEWRNRQSSMLRRA